MIAQSSQVMVSTTPLGCTQALTKQAGLDQRFNIGLLDLTHSKTDGSVIYSHHENEKQTGKYREK
jgi:hypothetical protein